MKRIILFDSECLLCNRSVRFIISRDPLKKFKFATINSEIGKSIFREYQIPNKTDSLILIEDSQYHIKSTAILKICRNLHGFPKCISFLLFIPTTIRDIFYDFIAKNRYKWFGKNSQCNLIEKDRFL